jgi:hypothetical protein
VWSAAAAGGRPVLSDESRLKIVSIDNPQCGTTTSLYTQDSYDTVLLIDLVPGVISESDQRETLATSICVFLPPSSPHYSPFQHSHGGHYRLSI